MLDQLKSGYRLDYFSQAAADYAEKMKPEKKTEFPKTIGEFSEKEWDDLLDKVDAAVMEENQFKEHVLLDNGCFRTMRFMKIDSMAADAPVEYEPDIKDTIDDIVADEAIQKLLGKDRRAPYSAMADENGIIEYKGVMFRCDFENNRLCLGNVSDSRKCITVELEGGGCLIFNRDNTDDLVEAIDMFSPTDINRIMRAIMQDAKLRQVQLEIEDESSGEQVLDKPKETEKAEAADKPGEADGREVMGKSKEED